MSDFREANPSSRHCSIVMNISPLYLDWNWPEVKIFTASSTKAHGFAFYQELEECWKTR